MDHGMDAACCKLLLLCLHTSAAACIAAGGRIAGRLRACGVRWCGAVIGVCAGCAG